MNTQEIINHLTKYDRLLIRDTLSSVYSRRYIDYMFGNGRKRTVLFRNTLSAYYLNKQRLANEVSEFINENKKEETTA